MAATSGVTTAKTYICSFSGCLKTFSRPGRLEVHQRSHTGEKPFQCVVPGCGKRYARSSHLRRHEENTHELNGELKKEVCCTVEGCGKKFTLIQNLNKHIKRKHTEDRFMCEYEGCGKSFKKNQHLKVHEFEHTNINPFVCSYEGCGMRFRVPSVLHRHEKVHTGYKCEESGCTEVFSKWTLLRKHVATQHAVEKKCPECDKTFSSRRWLKQHMIVHSFEREVIACPRENCGRTYLNQRNLLAHIRSYHDGKRKECQHPGCNRSFTSEHRLQKHQKVHNPDLPPPKKRSKKPKLKSGAAILCGIKKKDKHDIDDITSPQEDILNDVSIDNDDITTPRGDVSNDNDGVTTTMEDRVNGCDKDKVCVEMTEDCFVEKRVDCVRQIDQQGVEILRDCIKVSTSVLGKGVESMDSMNTLSEGNNTLDSKKTVRTVCKTSENAHYRKSFSDSGSGNVTSDPLNMTSGQQSVISTSCYCYKGQAVDRVLVDSGRPSHVIEHYVSSTCVLETGSVDSETGSVDSETGSVRLETGSVSPGTGSVDSETGSVDSETGSVRLETGSVSPGRGSVDSETGSVDSETGSAGVETGSVDSKTNKHGMVHTHIGNSPQQERRRSMCEQ